MQNAAYLWTIELVRKVLFYNEECTNSTSIQIIVAALLVVPPSIAEKKNKKIICKNKILK